MKKKIFICIGVALTAGAIFFIIFLGILTAYISNFLNKDGKQVDEPIPCTITGTKVNNKLNLVLSYDGMKIRGIKGTVGGSGTFNASKTASSGKTKMQLPKTGANLSVQTFMCYQAVTATGSPQFKLLNSKNAKDDGIYRKVGGKYTVALGSYYGSKMGTQYTIEFKQKNKKTKTIQAVLGDQKADAHTDDKHQYHKNDKSVVEFITAKGTSKNVSKTQKKINSDFGTITAIYRSGGSDVKLSGTIKGSDVTVTGSVDGIPLNANGSIKNGKIRAEGFIGEDEDYAGGGGVYDGGKFAWPVPGQTTITSPYGWRICPFHGREHHSGIDISAPYGKPVVAAANGTVVLAGSNGSYGNCVIISHGSGLFSLYGHNSSLTVRKGQKVKKGQQVAKIGSTGSSTGNHLHFEVRKGGNSHSNHTSPWGYLKKKNGPHSDVRAVFILDNFMQPIRLNRVA